MCLEGPNAPARADVSLFHEPSSMHLYILLPYIAYREDINLSDHRPDLAIDQFEHYVSLKWLDTPSDHRSSTTYVQRSDPDHQRAHECMNFGRIDIDSHRSQESVVTLKYQIFSWRGTSSLHHTYPGSARKHAVSHIIRTCAHRSRATYYIWMHELT